jgi:hypothetical protein
MRANGREYLVRELEQRMLPMLLARGFVRHPLSGKERDSAEVLAAFPLGCMKRARDSELEILEIQFDKHDSPRFVINVGKVPPEGISLPWGHFGQNEIGVSGLPDALRLYSSARWSRWFSLGWFARNHGGRAAEVVSEVIALYPEVELWFASGSVGPHMRKFGFPAAPPPSGR